MRTRVRVPLNGSGAAVDFDVCPNVFLHRHVQLMNGRQQLALAKWPFPDAQHARLGHCVGSGYFAAQLGTAVGLPRDEVLALKIAGLTHDIGHGACSHVIESITKLYGVEHHDMTLEKLTEMQHVIQQYCDYGLVRAILEGEHALSPFVSSIVGGDKVDYVMRDRHHCGFETKVDPRHIYAGARLVGPERRLAFEHRTKALTNLLREWWGAHTEIYLHKEVEIPRAMFRRAANFHHDATGWDCNDIYDMLDSDLEALFRSSPSAASDLQRHIDHGAQYHVYGALHHDMQEPENDTVVTSLKPGEFTLRHAFALEAELSKEAGIPRHGVIVTVSDGIDRLHAKGKANGIYEVGRDGVPKPFGDQHPGVVNGLEHDTYRHFALRVVVLPEYWEKARSSLPPLAEINARAEEMARQPYDAVKR